MKRWKVGDNDTLRHYEILINHYFPSIDIASLDDEEFAYYGNNAMWLHERIAEMNGAKIARDVL